MRAFNQTQSLLLTLSGLLILSGFGYIIILLEMPQQAILGLTLVLILITMCQVSFEPLHPIVLLLPFLFLYHYSALILDMADIGRIYHPYMVNLIAFTTIVTVAIGLINNNTKNRTFQPCYFISHRETPSNFVLKAAYIVLMVIIILDNVNFLFSGASSKIESNILGVRKLLFAHNWLILAYIFMLFKSLFLKRKFPVALFLLTLTTTTFSSLNFGERDILLSFVLTTALTAYLYYKPKKIYVFLLGVLILFTIPILGELKTFFVREVEADLRLPLWTSVIGGEFIGVGRNIDYLFRHRSEWDFFYGSMLVQDLIRALIPGILYDIDSSQQWFNKTFFPYAVKFGQGYGFSMSASWYINFGLPGVMIGNALIAFLAIRIYRRAEVSFYWMVLYIMLVPTFIYSIRGDISVLLSYMLKQVGLPMVIFILSDRFLKRAMIRGRTSQPVRQGRLV